MAGYEYQNLDTKIDVSVPPQPTATESAAREYLCDFCWADRGCFCPRCGGERLYRLADRRHRCGKCGYTFHDFSGRWLNLSNLSARQWLQLVRFFISEMSTRRISGKLAISYNTAHKAVGTIRKAILTHYHNPALFLGGQSPSAELCLSGQIPGAGNGGPVRIIPVFGILERNGHVWMLTAPQVKAEDVLKCPVKKVRKGNLVYTDPYQIYDGLMFCGYRTLNIVRDGVFSTGRVFMDRRKGFWRYAEQRLVKHHGVSPRHFPLYLKEQEFRYNHRNRDIMPIVLQYLCQFVPRSS